MAEYYLKPPEKQTFYRVLSYAMNLVGLGNRAWWGYEKPHKLITFNAVVVVMFAPICLLTQFIYLYANRAALTFDTIGIIFSIVPCTALANVNVFSARLASYKIIMNDFMSKIHIFNKYNKYDGYMKKKIRNVERFSRWTAYYLIFFFALNWVVWIMIPVLNNIKNKDMIQNRTMQLQTCVYMWFPFDYIYNYRNWLIVHALNIYVVACGVIIMMIFQTINYIFIYHLIGHIQILKHKLRTELFGNINDGETRDKLVDIVNYHAFITRVFEYVVSAFRINVAANYLHNLIGDSLIIYQIMNGEKENTALYLVMVFVYMGGLILMSFVLEEIKREMDDLDAEVYAVPWETMSINNQKIFLLILQRVQTILEFKALGGLKAGVQPMISILKTTFSYYVMLEATMAEKSI